MVDHILRRQRGVADREAMDPSREWLIGVAATALLVVIGGMVSYGFYLNTISLEVTADNVPAVAIPYNATVIDSAVAALRVRVDAYTKIRGTSGDETAPVTPVVLPDTPTESPTEESVPVPDELPATDTPADVETESTEPVVDGGVPELGV